MTATASTTKGPIHVRYDGGQVVVCPEDEDRFVMASGHVVSACQCMIAANRVLDQFKEDFLPHLHNWCAARASQVRACYVPFLSSGVCMKVFVVARSEVFDFDLSDAIAELEMELHRKKWPCDILQVSAGSLEELQAFFNPEQSIQVFGDGDSDAAPREGGEPSQVS